MVGSFTSTLLAKCRCSDICRRSWRFYVFSVIVHLPLNTLSLKHVTLQILLLFVHSFIAVVDTEMLVWLL